MLVCGISHFRASFVTQTPPLVPLVLFSVWLLVVEASFSPLLPPPLSLRDLVSRFLSPGPSFPRTSALSHSDPVAVSNPPSFYRLICSRFRGAVSAASAVRLSIPPRPGFFLPLSALV